MKNGTIITRFHERKMNRTLACLEIAAAFKIHPVVALLGPRQCGKTTLARQYQASISLQTHYFDLEKPTDLGRLTNPYLYLSSLEGLIIIDEIQFQPHLFPILRVLADESAGRRQFLILGSASQSLIQNASESLAGRIRYLELTPFTLLETGITALNRLWLRGGFPRSFLSETDGDSVIWRESYIRSFLEQDIPNLGIRIPAPELRRFWMMLTHNHAQIFNASELGRSLGLNHKTVRHYLDILTGTFMVRELPAWFENISKRQVKSPKIYFRDSGILHTLLSVTTPESLHAHLKLGASWEGFALEQVIQAEGVGPESCYFWATHNDAELDLLIFKGGKRLGYEFKFSETPKTTKSMRSALDNLKLDSLTIVYPGNEDYPLDTNIHVRSLRSFVESST